jgi:DNA primase catalytic core
LFSTNEILNEIYQQLDRQEVVKDLNPRFRSSSNGDYYEIDCPKCQSKGAAYVYSNGKQIICNRKEKCANTMSLWDYVQSRENLTRKETLERLATIAHLTLPRISDEAFLKMSKDMERAQLLDLTMSFFVNKLWSREGEHVRNYLEARGYSGEEIKKMGIGFNPSYNETLAYLRSQGYEDSTVLDTIKYLKSRDQYPLVFPFRDFSGRSCDLWGRIISKSVEGAKYKPYTEASKSTPFCLDLARGAKEIILVEGFLDALIALAKGCGGVVALGGSSPSESQIEALVKAGTKRVFIALDNDNAGIEGTEKSIKLLIREEFECYVVSLPAGYKDPDEFIVKNGIDNFVGLLKDAQSSPKWLAKRITEKHDIKTDAGRRLAIKEILEWHERMSSSLDKHDLLNLACGILDIPKDLLKLSLEDTCNGENAKKFKSECELFFKQGAQFLDEGNLEALDKLIKTSKPDLTGLSTPYIIQPYTLQKLERDLKESKEGLKTGYTELDAMLRIPHEAITLVGGRPSHGKTTLLLNLLLNVVKNYPDRHFYFFSYEETCQQIALKILNILSGEVFSETSNLLQLEGYLKSGANSRKSVEDAKRLYHELITSGRLNIVGDPYYVHELSSQIAFLKAKGSLGAIFIDYIQKVKNKTKFSSRQLELQNTSEVILETAKSCSVPIILGAQLGRDRDSRDKVKLDNLRESGDLEQDANLVLGLFNPVMEKALDESNQLVASRVVELQVTPLKNRNGLVNKTVSLEFDRPTLTIKDKKNLGKK